MTEENLAERLARELWPTLVQKHTKGVACNFQLAANELADAVLEECAKLIENRQATVFMDGFTSAIILRKRSNAEITGRQKRSF